MLDYKLSHTAQEIDAKLKRIEEGGTGYTEGETVHPIDPKYLPGVCLPVVEITTSPTMGTVPLSDAENAKLNEMAEIGTPFFAKIQLGGTVFTVSTVVMEYEGMIVGYYLILPGELGTSLTVTLGENGWELHAEPITSGL